MTFPKNLSEKIFLVNGVSMMIDVSIATVHSEVYFDYFLSFVSLFFQFFPFVCYKKMIFYFCVLVSTEYKRSQNPLLISITPPFVKIENLQK